MQAASRFLAAHEAPVPNVAGCSRRTGGKAQRLAWMLRSISRVKDSVVHGSLGYISGCGATLPTARASQPTSSSVSLPGRIKPTLRVKGLRPLHLEGGKYLTTVCLVDPEAFLSHRHYASAAHCFYRLQLEYMPGRILNSMMLIQVIVLSYN